MPIWDDPLSPTVHWARERFVMRFIGFKYFWRWLTTKPIMWADCGPYGERLTKKFQALQNPKP